MSKFQFWKGLETIDKLLVISVGSNIIGTMMLTAHTYQTTYNKKDKIENIYIDIREYEDRIKKKKSN